MTRAERTRLKWAVNGGGALWLVLTGWLMIATLPEGTVQNHGSSMVKDRMDNCAGTFSERFDCKQKIIIASGRETFYVTALRFLLVIVPPLVASGWLSSTLRKRPVVDERPRIDDGDWKARAQLHTQVQTPEQAARALHLHAEDLPHPDQPAHHAIDDIAPLDDWKARAHRNTRGLKREDAE
jgi:hypothetical protein